MRRKGIISVGTLVANGMTTGEMPLGTAFC